MSLSYRIEVRLVIVFRLEFIGSSQENRRRKVGAVLRAGVHRDRLCSCGGQVCFRIGKNKFTIQTFLLSAAGLLLSRMIFLIYFHISDRVVKANTQEVLWRKLEKLGESGSNC